MRVSTRTLTMIMATLAVFGMAAAACSTPTRRAPGQQGATCHLLAVGVDRHGTSGSQLRRICVERPRRHHRLPGTGTSVVTGTASGEIVSHTFSAGSHVVTLTVTDDEGATSSSSTTITSLGPPPAPTGLTKTGSGCCNTYGDFAWNEVPGATQYQIEMDGYLAGVPDAITQPRSQDPLRPDGFRQWALPRVAVRHSIRAFANGFWGPWSPDVRITL